MTEDGFKIVRKEGEEPRVVRYDVQSILLPMQRGALMVWVVWALKPGESRLAAICTTEEKAMDYEGSLTSIYPGFKMFREYVPLDHALGGRDSVQAMLHGYIRPAIYGQGGSGDGN